MTGSTLVEGGSQRDTMSLFNRTKKEHPTTAPNGRLTDLLVVSGFLGAGKTTLIQALLEGPFRGKRIVLIENDFGEISLDAANFSDQGFRVHSLSQGCICCSLTGEFVRSISALIESQQPDLLVIEPSGVGKLSDILKAIREASRSVALRLLDSVTVVDAKRCAMYQENFGDFFEDQIQSCKVVYLSHTDEADAEIEEARAIVYDLNPRAPIFDSCEVLVASVIGADRAKEQETVEGSVADGRGEAVGGRPAHQDHGHHDHAHGHHDHDHSHDHHDDGHDHNHDHHDHAHDHHNDGHGHHDHDHGHHDQHDHDHHDHGPDCTCGCHDQDHDHHDHDHDHAPNASDVHQLLTFTLALPATITSDQLKELFRDLDKRYHSRFVRIKGTVQTANAGMIELQYIPHSMKLRKTSLQGEGLTFIGRDVSPQLIHSLMEEKGI